EAVPAFIEVHVPGHLARERSVHLVHLLFDERVPRLPHHRYAARLLNRIWQRLRALHVEDYRCVLHASKDIARIQEQQIISPDDVTVPLNDADPVSVAVERNAEIVAALVHLVDEIFEILRNGRVRMVVGKRAVTFAEHARDFDTELCEQLWCDEATDAVTGIDRDPEWARDLANSTKHIVDVPIDDRFISPAALPLGETSGDSELVNALNVVAVDRRPADAELESVVLGRVVRSGNLDARDDVEIVLCPIRHRCRNDADVHDGDTALDQPRDQCVVEAIAAGPVVAADRDGSVDPALL